MSELLLFNKPYNVLSQFTDLTNRPTLADFISQPGFYPAGRLDRDSEGLLLLTNDGQLTHQISHPKHKQKKTYWVQVEGEFNIDACHRLSSGITLSDGLTAPAAVQQIDEPTLWPRTTPVRYRKNIPTHWLAITIAEGRNRQVRRMTAAVGLPTLRLVRVKIGPWEIGDLQPGEFRTEQIHATKSPQSNHPHRRTNKRNQKGKNRNN